MGGDDKNWVGTLGGDDKKRVGTLGGDDKNRVGILGNKRPLKLALYSLKYFHILPYGKPLKEMMDGWIDRCTNGRGSINA